MKTVLKVKIHDESNGHIGRIPEYIIMAQRIAWFCDGFTGYDTRSSRLDLMNQFIDDQAQDLDHLKGLEYEHMGRINAYR